jgi:hypothetical protein
MHMFTSKTLYILVTCSLEQSRQDVLSIVIDNINAQECCDDLKKNLIVFDNASTCQDTVSVLTKNFNRVYVSNKNVGYWSAIHWCLNNLNLDGYEYLQIIESDMVFEDYSKLHECEQFLNEKTSIDCVRTGKFDVENRRLYDKERKCSESFVNNWQTLRDCNRRHAYFRHIRDNFYVTNMPAQACGLLRINQFSNVISQLVSYKRFVEHDFQKLMFKLSNEVAIYDHGLYDTLGGDPKFSSVASSWPQTSSKFGYRESRADRIESPESYKVSLCCQHTITS